MPLLLSNQFNGSLISLRGLVCDFEIAPSQFNATGTFTYPTNTGLCYLTSSGCCNSGSEFGQQKTSAPSILISAIQVRCRSSELTSQRSGSVWFSLDDRDREPISSYQASSQDAIDPSGSKDAQALPTTISNQNWYVISRAFQLADGWSRGHTRSFAFFLLARNADTNQLMVHWDTVVRQFAYALPENYPLKPNKVLHSVALPRVCMYQIVFCRFDGTLIC
jgi:hypothetical protein